MRQTQHDIRQLRYGTCKQQIEIRYKQQQWKVFALHAKCCMDLEQLFDSGTKGLRKQSNISKTSEQKKPSSLGLTKECTEEQVKNIQTNWKN